VQIGDTIVDLHKYIEAAKLNEVAIVAVKQMLTKEA